MCETESVCECMCVCVERESVCVRESVCLCVTERECEGVGSVCSVFG